VGTIIVTGGASGIGAGIARRLQARPGTTVCIVDGDAERLAALGEEAAGADLRHVDVTDWPAMDALVADVSSRGPLEAVIANAGVSCVGPALEPDPSRWRRAVEVNTLGVMFTVRAALAQMCRQGSGSIVVIASASGRLSYVGEPAYVASKHATVAFCDSVRKEIVGSGVRMCVVEPGLVDTPMARSHPMIDEVLGQVTPLDVDDIARVVEFVLDQPAHCAINEILVRPTDQDL
jgi:NADP-dependent 3-hydroxy acid dehydrogenase YdfG